MPSTRKTKNKSSKLEKALVLMYQKEERDAPLAERVFGEYGSYDPMFKNEIEICNYLFEDADFNDGITTKLDVYELVKVGTVEAVKPSPRERIKFTNEAE